MIWNLKRSSCISSCNKATSSALRLLRMKSLKLIWNLLKKTLILRSLALSSIWFALKWPCRPMLIHTNSWLMLIDTSSNLSTRLIKLKILLAKPLTCLMISLIRLTYGLSWKTNMISKMIKPRRKRSWKRSMKAWRSTSQQKRMKNKRQLKLLWVSWMVKLCLTISWK